MKRMILCRLPKLAIASASMLSLLGCGPENGVSIISKSKCPVAISSGKYGGSQTFDAQRSPPYPVAGQAFSVSSFATPFDSNNSNYTIGSGEYITFFIVDGGNISQNGKTGCNVGIKLHQAGTTTIIQAGGTVWGLASEGFLHNSDPGDIGTFVSNSRGYINGDGVTYTPAGDIASCADLAAYKPSSAPLSNGEALSGECQ